MLFLYPDRVPIVAEAWAETAHPAAIGIHDPDLLAVWLRSRVGEENDLLTIRRPGWVLVIGRKIPLVGQRGRDARRDLGFHVIYIDLAVAGPFRHVRDLVPE